MRRCISMASRSVIAAGLIGGALLSVSPSPAHADWQSEHWRDRHDRRDHEWRDHDRRWDRGPPPGAYYAPPPVVYAPPPPPGLNVFLNFR